MILWSALAMKCVARKSSLVATSNRCTFETDLRQSRLHTIYKMNERNRPYIKITRRYFILVGKFIGANTGGYF